MAMDMPKDRYFFIQHPASGLVLEVDSDCFVKADHQISSFSTKECQLWYMDNLAIRNKANNLCMNKANGANAIIVKPYDAACNMQKWVLADKRLHLQCNSESAISIPSEEEPFAPGCVVLFESPGQEWEFVYTSRERKLFYIVNSATEHVMDVARSDTYQGAQVIIYPRSDPPRNNQLWYQGEHGCIHSRLNDSVLPEKSERMRKKTCAETSSSNG